MSQLSYLYRRLALVTFIILICLSIWVIDVRVNIKQNHQKVTVSFAFKTLMSPALEQASHSSLHDNTSHKGDTLQPMYSNRSSRDRSVPRKLAINNVVSGLPNQSALPNSLKNTSGTNPSSRNDLSDMSFSTSIHMKDYCLKLTQGTATNRLLKWAAHYHPPKQKKRQYIDSIWTSCDNFLNLSDYIQKPLNSQEESFPIAYSIVMYKDPEQVERLLHAIYRPQNHYCIHVDSKVSKIHAWSARYFEG